MISEKISKVMDKAELVKEEKGAATPSDIDRLYNFYLPKTIDVLSQYRNMFSSGLPPKSVAGLREDVLSAIKTSTDVYDNVLQSLFQSEILDLYTDMEVLQNMFAMEGLLASDFDIKV